MSPCPAIATYHLANGPCIAEWMARYVATKRRKDGADVFAFLPMVFTGHTESEARDAAEKFWRDEQRKEAAKATRAAIARAARDRASAVRVKPGRAA